MSLGNFSIGSTVRIPLQVLQDGVPAENIDSVKIEKIIKPDLSSDSSFPKDMTLVDSSYSVYYYDYTPEDKGNYIVVYLVSLSGISFSQIDSFFIAPSEASNVAIPSARASYVVMNSRSESITTSTSSSASEGSSSSGASTASESSESSSSEDSSSTEETSEKFRPSAKGL